VPFLSHSVSAHDAAIAARLRAVAAVYGIELELPDRPRASYQRRKRRLQPTDLSPDSQAKIDRTDVVIGLVTQDASFFTPDVLLEINYALERGKPVILLLEQGAALSVPAGVRIVSFDRANPIGHERELLNALKAIKSDAQRKTVGAFVGIALGLLALAYLSEK
jgi:hypothetical protein